MPRMTVAMILLRDRSRNRNRIVSPWRGRPRDKTLINEPCEYSLGRALRAVGRIGAGRAVVVF